MPTSEREWLDRELRRVIVDPQTVPSLFSPPGLSQPPWGAGTVSPPVASTGPYTFANVSGGTTPGPYRGPSLTDEDVRRLEHPEEFRR